MIVRKKIKTVLLAGLVLVSHVVLSQSSYSSYLANNTRMIASGGIPALPYELLRKESRMPTTLDEINATLSDTLDIVRRLGYQSLHVMQKASDKESQKRNILSVQMKGLSDASGAVQSLSADNLSDIPVALFNQNQKKALIDLLEKPIAGKAELIRLIGTLNESSAVSSLQNLSTAGNPAIIRWSAYLALSRLGNERATNSVLQKLNTLEVNTDVVYDILPSVIYTRQKPLYDVLVAKLYSEEKNCLPADPNQTRPINCAYRILEMLAPEIVDFPIGVSASGDLATRDYRKALDEARAWFTAHPAYEIVTVL